MNTFWKIVVSGTLVAGGALGAVYVPRFIEKVVDLDESEPAQEAAIAVSDPLLYARETLINDRREEYDYLTALLKDSADPSKVQFAPQVVRDMTALQALKLQASAQMPGAAEPPKVTAELPKPPPPPEAKPGEQQKSDAQGTTAKAKGGPASAPQEEFRDRQAYRGDLRAALASVNLDDLHDFNGNALFRLQFKVATFPGKIKNKFGVAQLTVQPPRLLEDDITSLYRMWLGHTSSRLNYFEGGKLVGDTQYGNSGATPYMKVIKLGLLKKPDPTLDKDPCLSVRPAVLRAAAQSELGVVIEKVKQGVVTEEVVECHALSLAIVPGDTSLEWLYTPRDAALLQTAATLSSSVQTPASALIVCRFSNRDLPGALRTAKDVLMVEPALEAALDGVIAVSDQIDRRKVANGAEAEELQGLRADYQALSAAAAEARAYLAKVAAAARTVKKFALLVPSDKAADCIGSTKIDENLGTFKVPDDFISKVIDKRRPRTDEGWLATGQAYGYGTTPIELAQRLSTTASTAASMEMALALSGKLQGDSGGVLGGSDYMRSMAQTAAFLERIPLVVGFSDRKPVAAVAANPPPPRQALPVVTPGPGGVAPAGQKPTAEPRLPQFGWVFGPRARFDMGRQRFVFEQSIGSFDVAADISVPSWWPKVELDVETAWIGNWHQANEILRKAERSPRRISVPLPMNRADFDGLTKFLMQDLNQRTAELTTIHSVEPSVLSACANEVTVLIYGANVWRSAEVYLGGLRGKEIKVLPDMEGISASFNLVDFYKNRNSVSNPLGYEEVILRVNTRNGRDLQPIRIVGSRQPGDGKDKPADCVSPYSVSSPIVRHQQTSAPTIFAMAPSSIERCTGTSQIMLTGRNLLTKQPLASDLLAPQVFLNGREGKVTIVNPTVDGGKRQVISITFDQDATDLQRDSHDLILLNPGGFTTARLSAIPCGGANKGTAPPAPSKPPVPPIAQAPQGAPPQAQQGAAPK
jgi:hypothetical protein